LKYSKSNNTTFKHITSFTLVTKHFHIKNRYSVHSANSLPLVILAIAPHSKQTKLNPSHIPQISPNLTRNWSPSSIIRRINSNSHTKLLILIIKLFRNNLLQINIRNHLPTLRIWAPQLHNLTIQYKPLCISLNTPNTKIMRAPRQKHQQAPTITLIANRAHLLLLTKFIVKSLLAPLLYVFIDVIAVYYTFQGPILTLLLY
jgi:hypothetical protein